MGEQGKLAAHFNIYKMALQKGNRAALLFLDGFLKINKSITKKIYLEKVLALVNLKLGIPCCDDAGATVDLKTREENNFTRSMRQIIEAMHPVYDKTTLIKLKAKLNKAINPCCV